MNLPQPEFLAILVLVEAAVIVKLWFDASALRKELSRQNTPGAENGAGNLAALYSKALTGSLDRFSVGEVLQFLNSIREIGILDILEENATAVHRLLIEDGDIIDAFNGARRGEEAVREILQCKEGTFTFIRGDLPSNERTVHKPTMTLLMESYQSLDEASLEEPLIGAGNLF